ncbi:hypothetical protein ACOMHN_052466 [Nucella lapillus]
MDMIKSTDDSREEELLGDGEMSLSQWLGDEIAITGDEVDLTDEDLTEIANQMFANCPPPPPPPPLPVSFLPRLNFLPKPQPPASAA